MENGELAETQKNFFLLKYSEASKKVGNDFGVRVSQWPQAVSFAKVTGIGGSYCLLCH